jgi:hypothetical protein
VTADLELSPASRSDNSSYRHLEKSSPKHFHSASRYVLHSALSLRTLHYRRETRTTVGERLGDELGELLRKRLSDDDKKSSSATADLKLSPASCSDNSLNTERRRQEVELSDGQPRAESSIALGQQLVPPLVDERSEALSFGIERIASPGIFLSALSTVGERLGRLSVRDLDTSWESCWASD